MKIIVGLSGGVDSATAAKMLLSEGHDVEGAVLIMHEHTELSAAREAACGIGISLREIDCKERFDTIIKENFISEYMSGRTPNPCVLCNERVKFAMLYEYAIAHGFDKIATGHYARIVREDFDGVSRYAVAMAEDPLKDQSYMLYRLPQKILSMLVLPLSEIKKTEVRAFAAEKGIVAADRPDSQEICFLPDGGYAEFIEERAGKCPEGDFISDDGTVLGRHKGIIRYTVGQRKGLGISLGERVFVTNIDSVSNTVTLSTTHVGRREVRIRDTVLSGLPETAVPCEINVKVKLRYTAPLADAVAELSSDGTALLRFAEPVKAAPGQSAVAYACGRVLFGGFIV